MPPRSALRTRLKESGNELPHSKTALLVLALLLAFAAPLRAADFIPLPNFKNHSIPDTQNPASTAERTKYLHEAAEAAGVEMRPASPELLNWLDMGALALGLALASYFALVRRSRRGLVILSIASLLWLGFWRKGCVCPIGAIQNVTLALVDSSYALPLAVVVFFVLPLVFTLFFGRVFCAAVCPLGAVQELVVLRPIKVPAWLDHSLGLLAYVYLGAAVALVATVERPGDKSDQAMAAAESPYAGQPPADEPAAKAGEQSTPAAFLICRYDPFVGLFRMSGTTAMLLVGAGFLVVGMFVGRPYCRYLCPYGAILGLLSPLARRHLRIPPKDCIQCRLCEESCPYGAIREPTVVPALAERRHARRRLAAAIVALPVLVAVGAWLGAGLGDPLAKLHPTVQLAERMWLEEHKMVKGTTDATDRFRETGRPVAELYHDAVQLTSRAGRAGLWLGAWVGLVIGVKLVHLTVRRRRSDYQPDRANCVSCGRCFWYCPSEQARQGWITPSTLTTITAPTSD